MTSHECSRMESVSAMFLNCDHDLMGCSYKRVKVKDATPLSHNLIREWKVVRV